MKTDIDGEIQIVDAHQGRKSGNPGLRIGYRKNQIDHRYIRTIPLDWMTRAAKLPGKCVNVAAVLWYLSGLKKSQCVTVTQELMKDFGITRQAYSRCLATMAEAGLVRAEQRPGKKPLVTILDV
jgi:hypothetical protein